MATIRVVQFAEGLVYAELDYNDSTLSATTLRVVNNSTLPVAGSVYRNGTLVGSRTVPANTTQTLSIPAGSRRAVTIDPDGGVNSPYELRFQYPA